MRNLYFSNVPATYRSDLYRFLYGKLDCEVCFQEPGSLEMGIPLHRWTMRELLPLVRQYRPSLVLVPEFSAVALWMLSHRKRFGFKVVSFCDDSIDMVGGRDFGWMHRVARRVVPRWLDGIILHSPNVRDWYRDRFGKGLLMPIIADERRVRPELERLLPMAERLRPGTKPIVGFVGRLVGLKNVPTLIRAFELLKERAQLVIIGDGEERASLEKMAPYALFIGYKTGDELLAWYNIMDILVLPSTQEAYGTVTGEALMAGAKVLVSSRAGSSSLVREGENGYVVDPLDAGAMRSRLQQLLDTLPQERPVTLRENLLPYRFEQCIDGLMKGINSL